MMFRRKFIASKQFEEIMERYASGQPLEGMSDLDGIELVPSFDKRCRACAYWLKERRRWQRDLRRHVAQAEVVHSGMKDVYRPINLEAHRTGVHQGKTTVFVRDTDTVQQMHDRTGGGDFKQRMAGKAYCAIFDRCMRYGVRTASLSLLKGRSLESRYAHLAQNPKIFHNTSYYTSDVIKPDTLKERLSRLADQPLCLVYCGRLVERKGVHIAIKAIARAQSQGASVTLDVIGDGPERNKLEQLVAEAGCSEVVQFHGAKSYDSELLRTLAGYDAMLFTPLVEDTPRMIFDGCAAGLPLIGAEIGYVRERIDEEQAGWCVPVNDPAETAIVIGQIARDRSQLARSSWAAREAAEYHSADEWYRRRAEWTIEAYQRDRRGG